MQHGENFANQVIESAFFVTTLTYMYLDHWCVPLAVNAELPFCHSDGPQPAPAPAAALAVDPVRTVAHSA